MGQFLQLQTVTETTIAVDLAVTIESRAERFYSVCKQFRISMSEDETAIEAIVIAQRTAAPELVALMIVEQKARIAIRWQEAVALCNEGLELFHDAMRERGIVR
jgi:hypothetical protein